jgi:ribose/xylose/arabinose/galactoside ABC-type transport system permease subunit
LLLLFNALTPTGFFELRMVNGRLVGSLVDVLNRGAPAMLMALGMTLVIGTGGIDLSVGAVMAIAGAIAAALIARPADSALSALDVHGSITAVICIALLASILAGVWNGLLVSLVDIQPIVATLILMVAGRGIAQLITAGQIITFNSERFEFLGHGTFLWLPFPITVVAIVTLLVALLTRATALGLFIESVGNNPVASRYSGINARTVKLLTYIACALCAGLAGMIVTSDITAADANNIGLVPPAELDAILAVAIGGTSLNGGRFSLFGSLIGALVIQTLTTSILTRGVDRSVTLVIEAGVVVGVCLLQSEQFRAKLTRLWRRG